MKTFRVDAREPLVFGKAATEIYAVYAKTEEEARCKVLNFVQSVTEVSSSKLSQEAEELLEKFGIQIRR